MSALYSGEYAAPTMLTRQQEALRRVRRMQEHARRTVEETNAQTTGGFARTPEPPSRPPPDGNAPNVQQTRSASGNGSVGGAPNILSQLFGGGTRPSPNSSGSVGSGFAGTGGLLDRLRGKGLTDSVGSLGDTLHTTLSSLSDPLAKLLDAFDIDGEKLILLLVMWIIFNERGDKTLLLALGYILL